MDVNMPVMDGIECTIGIHAVYQDMATSYNKTFEFPHIIALTAGDSETER